MQRLSRMLPGTPALVAACGLSLTLVVPCARANVRYTTETQMGSGSAAPDAGEKSGQKEPAKMPSLRSTTYVKGESERVETLIRTDLGERRITIYRYGLLWGATRSGYESVHRRICAYSDADREDELTYKKIDVRGCKILRSQADKANP